MKVTNPRLPRQLRFTTKYAQLENDLIEKVIQLFVSKIIPPKQSYPRRTWFPSIALIVNHVEIVELCGNLES